MTEGLINDCKSYTERIDSYKERLEKANYLISLYEAKDEKSQFVSEIVTKMVEAMGLDVEPDPVV